MSLTVQLVRSADDRVLIRDLHNGRDIGALSALHGDIAVRMKLLIRQWGKGDAWIRKLAVE